MLDDKFLTTEDVANFFKVSKRTLKKLVEDGSVPSPIVIGGQNRWRNSDLQQFISNVKQVAKED